MDNSLHGRQAYPGPFVILLTVKALKRREELIGIFHIESDSIVPHKDCLFAADDFGADLNHRALPLPCVFDGV